MIKLILYRIFNPILTAWAIKILSWEPPKQKLNTIRDKVIRKLALPQLTQQVLPPIQKPLSDYKQILNEHELAGKPIKPVKHRKPIPKDTICPNCEATYQFIYSNATKDSVKNNKGKIQKFKCKICKHQWFHNDRKKRPTWFCPYCGQRIDLKVHRKDFDKFKCINPKCQYKLDNGQRYTYREYHISMDNINQFVPASKGFATSHFSYASIAIALFFFISFPLSSREVANILSGVFGLSVSHQSIINWAQIMARCFYPILDTLPVNLSNIWVVDETYLIYESKWGYLFTVLDAEYGSIIAQIFSPSRSVASAYAVLEKASRRFDIANCGIITVVTDGLASYPPAIQLLASQTKGQFQHCKVIGLKDGKVKNQYRRYKNLVENYYSVLKPYYYRTRGFGSFAGAVTFSVLFTLYYNYLHPSDRFDDKPIIQIEGLDYSHPILSWKGLIEKASA
jgi:transposase-like protein